ncbi:rhizopine-binding protein, partial [Pseudomonas syringae pv. tagetis]
IVGIDGLADGLAAIKIGMLAAWVFQYPMAQATIALQSAIKMIKGEPVDDEVSVPFQLITPAQVAVLEQHYKQ